MEGVATSPDPAGSWSPDLVNVRGQSASEQCASPPGSAGLQRLGPAEVQLVVDEGVGAHGPTVPAALRRRPTGSASAARGRSPLRLRVRAAEGGVGAVRLYGPVTVYGVIARLPQPEAVRARSKAMAMLDAVLSPEWESRYYSYDTKWGPSEELASMRDGSGDDYAIVFCEAGVYAQATYHESPVNAYRLSPPAPWPGLFDSLPDAFRQFEREPAFLDHNGVQRASACLWRERTDAAWRCGDIQIPDQFEDDADGAEGLFGLLLEGSAEAYLQFAEEYYEMAPALEAVQHVYDLKPLTQEVVSALNSSGRLEDLAEDIAQIGYPI